MSAHSVIMRLDKTEFLMYNRNRTFVRLDACRADKAFWIVPKRKEEDDFVALCCTLCCREIPLFIRVFRLLQQKQQRFPINFSKLFSGVYEIFVHFVLCCSRDYSRLHRPAHRKKVTVRSEQWQGCSGEKSEPERAGICLQSRLCRHFVDNFVDAVNPYEQRLSALCLQRLHKFPIKYPEI